MLFLDKYNEDQEEERDRNGRKKEIDLFAFVRVSIASGSREIIKTNVHHQRVVTVTLNETRGGCDEEADR